MGERAPSETPGVVEWEITEALTGGTVYRGRRDVGPDDVEVVEVIPFLGRAREVRSDGPLPLWGKIVLGAASALARAHGALQGLMSGGRRGLYRKRLPLDGGFYLELVDRPTRRRGALAGFGLGAGRASVPARSSAFFGIDDDDGERARRPKGEGELRVRLGRGPSGDWEVARTEFLTDVPLGVEPEDDAGRGEPGPRWRVRISGGSRVDWPSADGAAGPAPPGRGGG